MPRRPKDTRLNTLNESKRWPIMSVQFWGEQPVGRWLLRVRDAGNGFPSNRGKAFLDRKMQIQTFSTIERCHSHSVWHYTIALTILHHLCCCATRRIPVITSLSLPMSYAKIVQLVIYTRRRIAPVLSANKQYTHGLAIFYTCSAFVLKNNKAPSWAVPHTCPLHNHLNTYKCKYFDCIVPTVGESEVKRSREVTKKGVSLKCAKTRHKEASLLHFP